MSMYNQFGTNADNEKNGVWLDYGEFRVMVARAGGANKRFAKLLEAKTKPIRRAMETGTVNEEQAAKIMREVYAETIVLRWETMQEGKFKSGVEQPNGEVAKYSKDAVIKAFKDLPDLFQDIQSSAGAMATFRDEGLEQDAGN